MHRREFILALTTAASFAQTLATESSDAFGKILPKRPLGATGEMVTMLGLGGFHIGWTTEALAEATIEAALEEGIRFFDTAESYGPGTSEERYGKYLVPKFRDQIFLMTKTTAGNAALAQEHLDASRKRLATDVIDLWQIHALESPEDVDARLTAGVMDVFLKAKESGAIRHIGFTGHASPYAHLKIMERYGPIFSAAQFPINPVDAAAPHSFVNQVIPGLLQQKIGILAMKTLADGHFFGKKIMNKQTIWETKTPVVPDALSMEDCLNFAWSLPISVLIAGAEKPEFIRDKAVICRNFASLKEVTRLKMIERVGSFVTEGQVEYYKTAALRS